MSDLLHRLESFFMWRVFDPLMSRFFFAVDSLPQGAMKHWLFALYYLVAASLPVRVADRYGWGERGVQLAQARINFDKARKMAGKLAWKALFSLIDRVTQK